MAELSPVERIKKAIRALADPSKVLGVRQSMTKARKQAEKEVDRALGFTVKKKKKERVKTVGE